MDNSKRRDKGMIYRVNDSILEEQKPARILTQKLNTMDRSDYKGISEVVKELFGKSDNAFVNPPFYCDYGFNIEVGKDFFANYNCTIHDVCKVKIGDNTVIGAGSVVTGDIPSWSVAAGNPCRVIRPVTEKDLKYYFRNYEIDEEAMADIERIWRESGDDEKYPK